MKQTLLKTTLAIVGLLMSINVFAEGFTADNGLAYTILETTDGSKAVEVTYTNSKGGSYTGDIVVPAQVTSEGVTYNVTGVGAKAFYKCTGMTSVVLPEGLKSIAKEAFYGCTALPAITIPSTVTEILSYAFYNCKALTSVNLAAANGIKNTLSAFDGCEKLESATLPATITLSKYMFGSCTSLKTIDWSAFEGAEAPAMPKDFFQYVNDVKAITLKVPATAYESFVANADWSKLTVETVEGPSVTEEGVFKFDAQNIPADLSQARKIVLIGEWTSADFKALSGAIGNNASLPSPGNDVLEVVDMSQAVVADGTSLLGSFPGMFGGTRESGIFYGCRALTTVTMPQSTCGFKSIAYAFQGCTALVEIDLSTCKSLVDTNNAFDGCSSLTSVTFPSTIKLEKDMFAYCPALTLIDWSAYEGTEAPTYVAIVDGFDPAPSKVTLIVPEVAYDSFAANTKWAKFNLQKAASSAIESVKAEKVEVKAVYDLNGRYVGASVEELPAGIYIVNGKKIVK